jgi:hypothetical protein
VQKPFYETQRLQRNHLKAHGGKLDCKKFSKSDKKLFCLAMNLDVLS